MKLVRIFLRVVLLSSVAAGFAGLTALYGRSVRVSMPDAAWRTERAHRPSAPELDRFPELAGEGVVVAVCAVSGRVVFRLRLSQASRSVGQPISLGLHEISQDPRT